MLFDGDCDVVIVGGVSVYLIVFVVILFGCGGVFLLIGRL